MVDAALPPETLGFREFAVLVGFKPGYITQLRQAGRLVLTDDGKRVRVGESLQLLADTRDPAKVGVAARHAASRAPGGAGGAPAPEVTSIASDDGDEAKPPATYTDPVESSHQRRRAKALADKAETDAKAADRDYRISLGELLEAGQVEHAVRGAVATFRTSLENLPNTLAPELAALTDEGRIRVVLGEGLEHVLEELARKFSLIAKADHVA